VIRDGAGKQFDPMIVDKFLKILPKHPKCSL
jgi:HD-GYP domain-containing protein (c-di-GMP phosphodiesterase class II)